MITLIGIDGKYIISQLLLKYLYHNTHTLINIALIAGNLKF